MEPPVTIRASYSSFTPGDNLPATRVVIHSTCPVLGWPGASAPGEAEATARYFAGGSSGGSAHYVVDAAGEQHCVPDDTQAWHAPPNQGSIGIEICSEGGDYPQSYSRDQWLSPQVWPAVARAAWRTRELCDRHGIPTVRIGTAELLAGARGVCGHVDVSQAWHQSDHSDPGPGFPWPEFMAAVTGAPPAVSRKDDPVSQIEFETLPNGGWRGAVKVESAASGSQVVDRQWITYSSIYGQGAWVITALDGGGGLIDRVAGPGDTPARPVGVVCLNNHDAVYPVPPRARTVTLEGSGGKPVAALISKAL